MGANRFGGDIFDREDIDAKISEILLELGLYSEPDEDEISEMQDADKVDLWVLDDLIAVIAFRENVDGADTFIRDSYFIDYAESFAYDIGEIEQDAVITNYVDWERYADDLKQDYSSAEYDGVTYYYR